jgi:hypothetical protein
MATIIQFEDAGSAREICKDVDALVKEGFLNQGPLDTAWTISFEREGR